MTEPIPHNPFAEILRAAELQHAPQVSKRKRGRKAVLPTGHVGSASELPSLLPASMQEADVANAADAEMVAAHGDEDEAAPTDEETHMALEALTPFGDRLHRDPRRMARALYWAGYTSAYICELLKIDFGLYRSWKCRGGWDDAQPLVRVSDTIEMRLQHLISKEHKEGRDYKEIDLLMRQMERTARIDKYQETGREKDLNPAIQERIDGTRRWHEKRRRDAEQAPGLKGAIKISDAQAEEIKHKFEDGLFAYQHVWYEAGKAHRIRNILKSRQIGATFFFAREALVDAIDTGRNQVFLSASKAQAHVFKHYMQELCSKADVEFKGEVPRLQNGAHFYFLGTNSKTAQSYHGNLYFDEIFWVPRFEELRKVASGMAIHKKWRQTYFSTPSSVTHEAYPFWTGELFNRGRSEGEKVEIDVSHAALEDGVLCADRQWRQIVTVEDAARGGCDLFDIEQLKLEYGHDEYDNLLMCQFVDDTDSIFPFAVMSRCMVDSWDAWESDYRPFHPRPFGDKPVWVGYDPGLTGDGAGVVVLAPPEKDGGKFRVLEKRRYKGRLFSEQANDIRSLTYRYTVEHISIDVTGQGQGVFEMVSAFFPRATALRYSVELKTKMVIKAQDVIHRGRLEFDSGDKELVGAFMMIRKVSTPSGTQMTYKAGRNQQNGHAEMAWATMNALLNEPLQGTGHGMKSEMSFF